MPYSNQETMHRLFLRNADKTFVVVSAPSTIHQSIQETRTAFKLGAKDYVREPPFSRESLLDLVKALLEKFADQESQSRGFYHEAKRTRAGSRSSGKMAGDVRATAARSWSPSSDRRQL